MATVISTKKRKKHTQETF